MKVGVKMKIIFMGTPDFAAHVLQKLIHEKYDIALVVSQPDRPVGRKKELLPTPVKKMGMEHHIKVFQPEKIKDDYQAIVNINPDIIITAAYGQLVPKALLEIPRLGCINVHASLLPKYRGGAPIHQAIIDGELETGVTIQYMEEKMDTGDVISQASIPIEPIDDVGSLFEKLSIVGADLLVGTLPSIKKGTNARVPQNHAEATYAFNIKREDELIDWTKTAVAIHNQIRGLNPWPTAYTTINGVNVKIFKSEAFRSKAGGFFKEAGTIIHVDSDCIGVITGKECDQGGDDALAIRELQLSGKKRMSIKDLLNGEHPFKVGAKFGG